MGKDIDLLDWDITDAPDPDEVANRPEAYAVVGKTRSHGLSRQTWIWLSGVIALVIGSISAFSTWDRWRVLADVRQAVTAEVQTVSWPNPLLAPANPATPEIQSITSLGGNTAQAEVSHNFLSPSGQSLTFTLTQFYQFTGTDWRRIPSPEVYWGAPRELAGKRVWVRYRAVDDDFMQEFVPFLDEVLAQACAEWLCPPHLTLSLVFSPEVSSPRLSQTLPLNEPNTIALLMAGVDTEQEISLPSPHASGYPTDAASRDALKKALALQTLINLATELAGTVHRDNAYLYALTARLGARLGLESPKVGQGLTVERVFEPGELWEMAYARLWQSPDTRHEALRAALGSLNVLLADSATPSNMEAQLFASLRQNFSSTDWYVDATDLAPTEAREKLRQALGSIYRVGPFTTPPDLLLSCLTGPALYHLGEERGIGFLPFIQGENTVVASSWSPDGQWVALFPPLSQQAYLVNVVSGEVVLQDLPVTNSNNFTFSPQAWVSDTVLAYIVRQVRQPSLLRFLDIAHTTLSLPEIENVSAYVLARDGQTAVIQRNHNLDLIPALGGEATPVGQGQSPHWSPDGQSLLFMYDAAPSVVTWVSHTIASGQTQVILDSARLGGYSIVDATWSPTENLVALAMLETGSDAFTNNFQIRVGAMAPTDSQVHWRDSDLARTVLALEFSADGKLLATRQYDQQHRSAQTVVYDVATGQRLREIDSVYAFAWSPTGQRLAISSASGVYLITDAANLASPPKLLTRAECYQLVWNPVR